MGKEFAKIKDAFYKLNFILTREQKWYSVLVFFFSMISAVFEMLGVSILIPMINVFLEPETLAEQPYIAGFICRTRNRSYCFCVLPLFYYMHLRICMEFFMHGYQPDFPIKSYGNYQCVF